MNGTRIDPFWRPDANLLAWSKGRRPDLDIEEAIAAFVDYWVALPGKKATKLDWNATWRNFLRSPVSNQARPQAAFKPQAVTPSPVQPTPRRSPEERTGNVQRFGEVIGEMFGWRKA